MSKTYTLTATVIGKRGPAHSATLANATENYSGTYIGSTGSTTHYSCILAFDSEQMAVVRALGADAIASATLNIHASTAASNPFHPYYGAKKASGTASAEIVSSNQVAVVKNQTDITIDVTSLGIPATNAFCIGSQANTGETYATMRGISATLTIVAISEDLHIKDGGQVYDGELWTKKNGQMYRGELWHKVGGVMYRGG